MIRIMIVDDEPFIRKGLKILIKWENYGFEIVAEASNGIEALDILKNKQIDLIITDIKMPRMDGLSLIEYVKKNVSEDIRFIILSGFCEYEYTKQAIKYGVEDYILKPVQKDELISLLEECKERYYHYKEEQKRLEQTEKIVLDNYISHLLCGIVVQEEIDYIREYLCDDRDIRYIGLEYNKTDKNYLNQTSDKKFNNQMKMYDVLKNCLNENWYHAFMDTDRVTNNYMVGFIYAKKMAEEAGICEKVFIHKLYKEIREKLPDQITLFIGQMVSDVTMLSESYKSAIIARNFQHFSNDNEITFFDEIKKSENSERKLLYKDVMDGLIRAIEENNEENIMQQTDEVYSYFKEWVADSDIIRINLGYLLFSLMELIKKLAPDDNHDDIYRMMSLGGKEQEAVRGSLSHIREFSKEVAQYINELRKNTFGGVLGEVEREIVDNYADNLSLKSLSDKYYINSAYLGQIFKKKYGVSFKDYLNNYRIEKAAELLSRTDKKIYLIAEAVGFNNTDYFVSKFVQLKGITPLQFRKQFIQK